MERVVLQLGRGEEVRGRPNSGSSGTGAAQAPHAKLHLRPNKRYFILYLPLLYSLRRSPVDILQKYSGHLLAPSLFATKESLAPSTVERSIRFPP